MGLVAFIAQAVGQVADVAPEAEAETEFRLLLVLGLIGLPVWVYVAGALARHRSPVAYEGRRRAPWRGSDVLVVVIAAVVIQFLLPALLLQLKGVKLVDGEGQILPQAVAPFLAADSVAQLCALLVSVGLLMARTGVDWHDLGFGTNRLPRDLLVGLLAFLAVVPVILFVQMALTRVWPSEHPLVTLVQEAGDDQHVLALAAWRAVVIAPLVEEFLFRVVLQGWLQAVERSRPPALRWAPRLPAGTVPVLVSSAIFAGLHAGHGPDPIPLFLLALALGYLFHQTHRIWPSWMVHTLLNGMSVAALWTSME